jgi:hypothetical protein
MTEAALLEHISRLPHGKANLKQLIRELVAGFRAGRSWRRCWLFFPVV